MRLRCELVITFSTEKSLLRGSGVNWSSPFLQRNRRYAALHAKLKHIAIFEGRSHNFITSKIPRKIQPEGVAQISL